MEKISYINGPGSHGAILLKAIVAAKISVRHFQYYPKFTDDSYEKGVLESRSHSHLFQIKDRFIANYHNKLRNNNKRYIELLLDLFDTTVAKRLDKSNTLIAWPQVSLKSMRKVKGYAPIILEYPMIHVDEWQRKMKNEYARLGINHSKNIFLDQVEKKMQEEIGLADKINVLSSYAKQTFINNGIDESKLSVVPPYVDGDIFYINDKPVKEDKFTFLFVGRIDILKGAHLLLEAFSRVAIKDSRLVLVGHLNDEIKPFILQYSGDVKILPYQNSAGLRLLYNTSHALILPSIQESFGMVCLEAMSCGLPVIVSSNTGAGDMVGENSGFVFEAGDIDALIYSFRRVYENYSQFKASEIRENTLSKFNPEKYTRNYLEVLDPL